MKFSWESIITILLTLALPCSMLNGQVEVSVETVTFTAGNDVSLAISITSLDGPVVLAGYNIPVDIGNDGFGIVGGVEFIEATGMVADFGNFSFAETTDAIFNYDFVASDSDPDGIIIEENSVELLSIELELDKELPGQTLDVSVVSDPLPNPAAFSLTIDGETSNAAESLVQGAVEIRLLVPGDVDLNGTVNLLDVFPFVQLLQSGNFQIEADINCDYHINLLDIFPFVDLLVSN